MNTDFSKIFNNETTESQHPSSYFPKNIFLMCCGSTGAGKTNLLFNILLNGKIFYNDICIWSPTIHQAKYQGLQNFYKLKKFNSNFFKDSDDIPNPDSFNANKTHVMVFDDVMNKNQNKIADYFCYGRHNNFNVFYLAQSLLKTPKHGIRENCNIFILFKQNLKTLRYFYESHISGDMEFEEFKEFCERAWAKDYGYVVINLWSKPNRMKYIDNYKEVYIPKSYT